MDCSAGWWRQGISCKRTGCGTVRRGWCCGAGGGGGYREGDRGQARPADRRWLQEVGRRWRWVWRRGGIERVAASGAGSGGGREGARMGCGGGGGGAATR